MTLPAYDESSEVVKPREEAFDLPAAAVTTQFATVLRPQAPVGSVRRDHPDPTCSKPLIERVAVVGFVADHALGEFGEEALLERRLDERDFIRRSACNPCGDRKTVTVCQGHDLGALAALGLSDERAPFFAEAKVPSMYVSVRSIPPRSLRSAASVSRIRSSVPSRLHCWKRRWQVERGGYRSGRSFHCAPVRRIQRIPSSTSRALRHGRPRPSLRRFGFGICGSIRFHCPSLRFKRALAGEGRNARGCLDPPNRGSSQSTHLWDRF